MNVTDGELLITQTVKATKHAIISDIRKDLDIGVNLEVYNYLQGLIERIENLKV
jgi:hypothetical protein